MALATGLRLANPVRKATDRSIRFAPPPLIRVACGLGQKFTSDHSPGGGGLPVNCTVEVHLELYCFDGCAHFQEPSVSEG